MAQRGRSSNRDSAGNINRLIDLANKPSQSATTVNVTGNPVSGGCGSPSASEMSTPKYSASKDSPMYIARNSSFPKEGPQSDSRPSTPQSQTDAAMSVMGIDIPNSSVPAGSRASVGGSSSSGENQFPSLMSVINSAPPSLTLSTPSQDQTSPVAGNSSSSDVSGAGNTSLGLSSPGQQGAGSSPFPVRCTSDDGSSKDEDSLRSDATPLRGALTPDSLHQSGTEPSFLKPGELSPFADFQTPAATPNREDRSPKGGKKKPKSSPWYSVLASTYKSKCEEFRKLFKTIPSNERLLMDYSCALQKDILVHGRMFITEGWLCFYANIFKWETLLTIRFKDVTAITKERTIRFIPNAIQISTDSEKYFFTSFMSREKSFLLLFRIWQNALLEQTMPSNEYWSWVHSNYGSDLGIQGEELPDDFMEGEEELEPLENEDSAEDISQSLGSEEHSFDGVYPGSKSQDSQTDERDLSEGITMTVSSLRDQKVEVRGRDDSEDIGEVMTDPLSTLDFGGKEVINETFDIPVDQVFTALYDSQNPIFKNYLDFRKCTDVDIGDWSRHDSDRDIKRVTYTLHLNTALGYKAAGVEEKLILQKNWSKTGHSYIVEKEVYNKNVPYCDYFYVRTLHVLTKISPTLSRVRVIMKIEFVKSALGLVKTFVERNVESGVKQGEKELLKFMRENLEAAAAPQKKRKTKKRRAAHPHREQEEKKRMDVPTQPSTTKGFLASLAPVWFQSNSEGKVSLQTTMAFISIILAVLCVFNVSLFLQLKSIEEFASKNEVWSNAQFVQKLGELPKSQKDWAVLLQQQQQIHNREMQKWRDIVDLCIQLIKQMESTLTELHKEPSSDDIPNIQDFFESDLTAKDSSNLDARKPPARQKSTLVT